MKKVEWLSKVLLAILSICLVAGMATGVQAGEYSFGAGVAFAPDYEGSSDYSSVVIPFGMAKFDNGMYVRLEGPYARANLIPGSWVSWLEAGLSYNYRPSRSRVDNDQVSAMKNISDANELGAFVGVNYNNWYARLEYLEDVGNAYNGWTTELKAGYNWIIDPKWRMLISGRATYANSDYMDTYFGVNPANVLSSGLPLYAADSGVKDAGVELRLSWNFWNQFSALGILDYARLLNDADESSPVTNEGSANQFIGGLVLLYSF